MVLSLCFMKFNNGCKNAPNIILKLQIRALWRHYFQNIQGLVFVVDSNNRERISEARNELHRIFGEVSVRIVYFGIGFCTTFLVA